MTENLKWNDGMLKMNNTAYHWNDFWDRCYPAYQPVYTQTINLLPNKFELAFKIVSKLLEKGAIKELEVSKFVELVNSIAELI